MTINEQKMESLHRSDTPPSPIIESLSISMENKSSTGLSDAESEKTLSVATKDEQGPDGDNWSLRDEHLRHATIPTALLGPFSLDLDAGMLVSLSVLLTIAVFALPRMVFALLLMLTPPMLLLHHDFQRFIALGPGGTPQTLMGYLGLLRLRPFVLQDLFSLPPGSKDEQCSAGILDDDLPYRSGPPPRIEGVVPERQVDHAAPPAQHMRLTQALKGLAASHPDELGFDTSTVDRGHGAALFVRHPLLGRDWSRGEVCHVHDFDGSMHLSLGLDDVAEVLRKGWGRRHPMTGVAPGWEWAVKGRLPALPATFVMIYAPRDETDLKIISRIIDASTWYISGKHFELKLPS